MYTLTRSWAPDQEEHWEEVKLEEEEMKVEQYEDEDYDPWDESWWQDTEEEVAEEPAVDHRRGGGRRACSIPGQIYRRFEHTSFKTKYCYMYIFL